MVSPSRFPRTRTGRVVLGLAVVLSLVTLIQALHEVRQGSSAVLRWQADATALERGEPIYGVGREGYPTLPVTLVFLRPFHAAGEVVGPFLWAAFELGLAWWMVLSAFRLAGGEHERLWPAAALLVLLLSFRVLRGDVLHGNINLAVSATVVASMVSWSRDRPLRAGLWAGFGAVVKVTPALLLGFFLWKRDLRAAVGFLAGLVLFAFLVPGVVYGWERNLELAGAWWTQMVEPYLAETRLEPMQTRQVNQSLYGVLARWLTDSVAIEARPPTWPEDVRLGVLSLAPETFRLVHRTAALAVLVFLAWATRGADRLRGGRNCLGAYALVALAMLLLSERSWKHHWVLLFLATTYLAAHIAPHMDGWRERVTGKLAVVALAITGVAVGLTGSAVLGDRGSDLAEAWGSHFAAGVVLFLASGFTLREARR